MKNSTPGDRLAIHYSSARADWATPPDLFAALDAEFGFTLDAAALPLNAKCAAYLTPADDALAQSWSGTVWLNPPYGRGIHRWIEKAIAESDRGSTVVLLVPARFDTRWGQALLARADEVRHIAGRVTFVGATEPAPFPSAVVVLRGRHAGEVASNVYRLPTRHDRSTVRWTTMRTVRDAG